MKTIKLILFLMLAFTIIYIPNAQSSGEGTVSGVLSPLDVIEDLSSTEITVFDSLNAEIIGSSVTIDDTGYFSGSLPAGSYKLYFRYVNKNKSPSICFEGFFAYAQPGGFITEVFDTAQSIEVTENNETDLGEISIKPRECINLQCVDRNSSIRIQVFDSSTNLPVSGIYVQFKDPETAFPIYSEVGQAITDANGSFLLSSGDINICDGFETKIRFYDPQGYYNSEYYNSSSVDVFAQGQTVEWFSAIDISEGISKITPSQQVGDLIGDIGDVLPPEEAQYIVTSLTQSKQLLDDTNPNNDNGVCGILKGTIAKLNNLVSDGSLTQAEADVIETSIEKIRNDLGCK